VEFLLPYYSLHGTYLVEVLWRLRYMHASREIAIYSDAVALNSRERLGPSRLLRILARELWKSYVRPTDPYQRFFWYAEEGAEPAPIVPVFRYRVLLPADALEKHRRHVSMYGELEEYRRLHEDVAGGLRALRGERGRRGFLEAHRRVLLRAQEVREGAAQAPAPGGAPRDHARRPDVERRELLIARQGAADRRDIRDALGK